MPKALYETFNMVSGGIRYKFYHPEHGGLITSQPAEWGKTSNAVKSMQTAAKNLGKSIIVKDVSGKHVANIHADGWKDLTEEVELEEGSAFVGNVYRDGTFHKAWKDANGEVVVKNTKTGEEHRGKNLEDLEKHGYSQMHSEEHTPDDEKKKILFNIRIASTEHYPTKHLNHADPEIAKAAKEKLEYIKNSRENSAYMNNPDKEFGMNESHVGFATLAAKVGPRVAAYIGDKKYGKKKMEKAAEEYPTLTDSIKSALALKMLKKELISEGFAETNTVVTGNNSGVYFFNEETKENVVIRGGIVMSLDEAKEKLDSITAKSILSQHGDKDFYQLSSSEVLSLLTHAKKYGYRKSKYAAGSTARMFHQHLKRLANKE